MHDLITLQLIALALIGFGAVCAIGLCLATLWIEPKNDPIEKIDTERL